MTRVLYLVHNLNDSAVNRRVGMLRAGGAEVSVVGFWRGEQAPGAIAGATVLALSETHDSNLAQRATMVARYAVAPGTIRAAAADADVVVARNLEMLVLAARIRRPPQRLVYECLDIHRTMMGRGLASAALRALERSLLRRVSLLIVSSPAFLRSYFRPVQDSTAPSLLVENKLLALSPEDLPEAAPRPAGPPWTIGWFGNLRCRRSLDELAQIAQDLSGQLRVLTAGRASPAEFPQFGETVARPFVTYSGTYTAEELPRLYGRCHFAWCIDYFEEGLNSEWLLPNRLYESIACGAIPIAREGTETARWLKDRKVGVELPREHTASQLRQFLSSLTAERYQELQGRRGAVAPESFVAQKEDCRDLVQEIAR